MRLTRRNLSVSLGIVAVAALVGGLLLMPESKTVQPVAKRDGSRVKRVETAKSALDRLIAGHEAVVSWETRDDGRIITSDVYETSFMYPVLVERTWTVDADTGKRNLVKRSAMAADHVVLRLREGSAREDLEAICKRFGATIRKALYIPNAYQIKLSAPDLGRVRKLAAQFEEASKAVAYSEPDFLTFPCATPNDTDFAEQWALHNTGQTGGNNDADVDATEAWDITTGSNTVLIGITDSGFDYTHPDLVANTWTNPGEIANNNIDDDGNGLVDDVHGYDFQLENGDAKDTFYHGTHCAGIVGAVGNNNEGVTGACWTVKLVSLQFNGEGGIGLESNAAEATQYAADIGCAATSNSYGGSDYSQVFYDAIEYAGQHDMLVVCSAGNSSVNTENSPRYPGSYPHDNIIAVAATTDEDTRAGYSSYGPTTVDVGAPGSDILSTLPSYLTNDMEVRDFPTHYYELSGTSMATPLVAGICGLVKSHMTEMPMISIKQKIMDTVDPLSSLDGKVVTGGRVNAQKALQFSSDADIVHFRTDIDDSAGDDNGYLNPGETIVLSITLENDGLTGASGVSMVLSTSDSNITITDANASYGNIGSHGAVKETTDSYTIEIDPSCPTPRTITFDLAISDSGSGSWTDSFTLPVYTMAEISGTVTLDGSPLSGATVTYEGPLSGELTTTGDGNYSFVTIDGAYKVKASKSGYYSTGTRNISTPPADNDVDFTFTTATISGTVTQTLSGDPISGVTIDYDGAFEGDTTTAADGSYSITHVYGRSTTLTLTASKDGYFDTSVDATVPPSTTVDITMGSPEINVTPMDITVNADLGQSPTRTLTIENDGGAELDWEIPITYIATESTDAGGPTYNWIEISGTGTEVTGLDANGDNANVGPFDIGFDFPYYDRSWSTFRVCTNGFISFNATETNYQNWPLPINEEFHSDSRFQMIALNWEDFITDSQSHCYYELVDADTLVVQYQDFIFNNLQKGRFTGQLILKSTGEIIYQYKVHDSYDSGTIGIQEIDSEDNLRGLGIAYSEAHYPADEFAIRITKTAPWLSIGQASGTIAATSSDDVTLTLNSSIAGLGNHTTALQVQSNDLDEPDVTVNISFNVTDGSGETPGTLAFSASTASVNEDAGTVTLTVTRTGGSDGAASVDFATADDTATVGQDYTAQTDTLTWAEGNSDSKSIVIDITDDSDDESDETFTITLSNASGASLGIPTTATVTIADDDETVTPGTLNFQATTASVNENAGTVTLTVTRTGGSDEAASVDFATSNGSAQAGSDYTATSSTLNWSNGDSATKDIVIDITNDVNDESDETFTVTLSGVSGASLGSDTVATVTIVDNDAAGEVTLSVSSISVDEDAGTVELSVTRTGGNDGAISVDYATADDSAIAGQDYTAVDATLNWANNGSATKTITIDITDDAVTEGDESFTLTLSNATNGASIGTATATVTINANDQYGEITLPVAARDVAEDVGTISVTVERNGGNEGEVSVYYETVNDTATAGNDYSSTSGTLTWAEGNADDKTIEIAITDDNDTEGDEDFRVELSSPTGGATIGNDTETITILANDSVNGVIGLSVAGVDVDENAGTVTLTVRRTGGSDGAVSVDYATADDTATAGADYTAVSGTLSWVDGNADDQTIEITITDDSDYEGGETFKLTLTGISGGAVYGIQETEVTIIDDDGSFGVIGLSVANVSVDEDAGTVSIDVTRTGGSDGAVSVDYATTQDTATAGADYSSASGTLTWADGNSDTQTIEISITDDAEQESDESFTLDLNNVTGGASLDTASATIAINANDAPTNNDPVIIDGPNAAPTTVTMPAGIALDVTATDADGDTLSYIWSKQSGPGNVAFTAQAANSTATFNEAGSYTLQVTVTDGKGGSASGAVNVTVEAAPTTGDGDIVVTGNTDFGATYVEDGSSVRTFTIKNEGMGVLLIEDVTLGGTDMAEFSITADPALSIAVGSTTAIEVTFDPSSEGSKAATLTIQSDDPTDGTVVLDLSGEALAGSTPAVPPPSDDDDGCNVGFGFGSGSFLFVLFPLLIALRRRFNQE